MRYIICQYLYKHISRKSNIQHFILCKANIIYNTENKFEKHAFFMKFIQRCLHTFFRISSSLQNNQSFYKAENSCRIKRNKIYSSLCFVFRIFIYFLFCFLSLVSVIIFFNSFVLSKFFSYQIFLDETLNLRIYSLRSFLLFKKFNM